MKFRHTSLLGSWKTHDKHVESWDFDQILQILDSQIYIITAKRLKPKRAEDFNKLEQKTHLFPKLITGKKNYLHEKGGNALNDVN